MSVLRSGIAEVQSQRKSDVETAEEEKSQEHFFHQEVAETAKNGELVSKYHQNDRYHQLCD